MIASFTRELEKLMGKVHRVADDAQARARVLELLEARGVRRVLAWDDQWLRPAGLGVAPCATPALSSSRAGCRRMAPTAPRVSRRSTTSSSGSRARTARWPTRGASSSSAARARAHRVAAAADAHRRDRRRPVVADAGDVPQRQSGHRRRRQQRRRDHRSFTHGRHRGHARPRRPRPGRPSRHRHRLTPLARGMILRHGLAADLRSARQLCALDAAGGAACRRAARRACAAALAGASGGARRAGRRAGRWRSAPSACPRRWRWPAPGTARPMACCPSAGSSSTSSFSTS